MSTKTEIDTIRPIGIGMQLSLWVKQSSFLPNDPALNEWLAQLTPEERDALSSAKSDIIGILKVIEASLARLRELGIPEIIAECKESDNDAYDEKEWEQLIQDFFWGSTIEPSDKSGESDKPSTSAG